MFLTFHILLPNQDDRSRPDRLVRSILLGHGATQKGTTLHHLVVSILCTGAICHWLFRRRMLNSGDDVGCIDALGFLRVLVAVELIQHSFHIHKKYINQSVVK